ncbi:hypothetical protein JCM17845_11090 [Iodidimonas gelatinilytica]|uniref:Serine protease n=1 Tax=Iodidimonas gelatinilytica TaxID=1236966 RepID=A0A5A7N0B6_9PROT|nr:serine protease [Iodidimonas gelatinilytica]GER00486.1 hypothetical protein JCM17845_11090 [Iodidimonas gelatinilytica]
MTKSPAKLQFYPMIFAGLLALLFSGAARSFSPITLCYDKERDIVQSVLSGTCEGDVVTAEEAQIIRDRIKRERLSRILPATSHIGNDDKSAAEKAPSRAKIVTFGTAFSIDERGYFLTARHVVDQCDTPNLNLADGTGFEATILLQSPDQDIALLYAPALQLPPLLARPDHPARGDSVTAIGYPEQGLPRIRPGSIDGVLQDISFDNGAARFLAFKAPVRGGNSGGPLFDNQGALVGMVIAKANSVAIFQASGSRVRNMAFAIANESLDRFLKESGLHLDTYPGRESDRERAGDGPERNKLQKAQGQEISHEGIVRVVCRR